MELNKVWNAFHVLVIILGLTLAILPCIYRQTPLKSVTTTSTP
jgi:thiol:disulfide interchange protein